MKTKKVTKTPQKKTLPKKAKVITTKKTVKKSIAKKTPKKTTKAQIKKPRMTMKKIKNDYRVGFVGYSSTSQFNVYSAMYVIRETMEWLALNVDAPVTIVAGLTNIGLNSLVYNEASKFGFKTVGIACEKANHYECFPVSEKIIVGKEWGDESETFVKYIDSLVRIGGGKQSMKEIKMFKEIKPQGLIAEYMLDITY